MCVYVKTNASFIFQYASFIFQYAIPPGAWHNIILTHFHYQASRVSGVASD